MVDFSGFKELTPEERLQKIKAHANLTDEEVEILKKYGKLDLNKAGMMIENVFSTNELPLGLATNFLIDSKEYVIPMCIEEPSVVAAASYAAKLAREGGGFTTRADEPEMIGQIQLVNVSNAEVAAQKIFHNKQKIIEMCNAKDPVLVKYGGGCKDVYTKTLHTDRGTMLIVYIIVDVRDAMGANAINTMAEHITPYLEELTGAKHRLRIISNLADRRKAYAEAIWKKEIIGEDAVEGILDAYEFAKHDIYRCVTHNKGIMNGIDALTIATGNDFRAVEAGAHAYASIDGYHPLTKYEKTKDGDLKGTLELPLVFGTVGGATRTNPIAQISLKILGVKSAQELARIAAALGLAQNFAALRALSQEGIQLGHMRLHAKNIAITAGAQGEQIEAVAKQMIEEKNITVGRAKEILDSLS